MKNDCCNDLAIYGCDHDKAYKNESGKSDSRTSGCSLLPTIFSPSLCISKPSILLMVSMKVPKTSFLSLCSKAHLSCKMVHFLFQTSKGGKTYYHYVVRLLFILRNNCLVVWFKCVLLNSHRRMSGVLWWALIRGVSHDRKPCYFVTLI